MPFTVVIPARYGSTRLPAKPLLDIHGKPMIVRVVARAQQSAARQVVVATDDERLRESVESTGCTLVMTRADHPSGSDRVMEVAERMAWADDQIVVNVQGDEPMIPPSVIDQVALQLQNNNALGVATLCDPITDADDIFDPNVVKVVVSRDGRALYFSRAPVPWQRGKFEAPGVMKNLQGVWWKHIGIYGYRIGVLRQFVSLNPSMLETTESLEQLRLLENGIAIAVEPACEPVSGGVDTPADLEKVRRLFDKQ